MKTKLQKNKLIIIFLIVSIILNFALIYFHFINKNCVEVQEVLFTETKKDFNSEKKYYATIDYNKFKKLFKSEKLSTIAVLDNSSNTHDKFIELINSISYYKSTKIYLLETSKLSKKNEVSFFEIDERFKELETNYIITVSKGKVVSVTTFENTKLNVLIERIGE